ncbi:hypothetical protein Ct61P_14546 [Colletotrichum tofieldiae]|nr:hypothetical protein Ct61P_14546 [Colletotrichum tofieldiae]
MANRRQQRLGLDSGATTSAGSAHSAHDPTSSPLDSALTLPRRDTTATSTAQHASASQPEYNDGLGYRNPLQCDLNTTAAGDEAPVPRDAVPREYYAWVLAQLAPSKARKSLKQAETAEREAENGRRRWQRTNEGQKT